MLLAGRQVYDQAVQVAAAVLARSPHPGPPPAGAHHDQILLAAYPDDQRRQHPAHDCGMLLGPCTQASIWADAVCHVGCSAAVMVRSLLTEVFVGR